MSPLNLASMLADCGFSIVNNLRFECSRRDCCPFGRSLRVFRVGFGVDCVRIGAGVSRQRRCSRINYASIRHGLRGSGLARFGLGINRPIGGSDIGNRRARLCIGDADEMFRNTLDFGQPRMERLENIAPIGSDRRLDLLEFLAETGKRRLDVRLDAADLSRQIGEIRLKLCVRVSRRCRFR